VLIKGRSPDVGAILESAPPQRRADVARGIGTALRYRENKKTRRLADDEPLLVGWLDAGAPHAEQVVEGLCFDWSFVTSTGTAAFVEENGGMLGGASARLKPSLARGLGHACGRLLRRGIEVDRPAILAQLARVPSEHRVAALEGLGAGLADGAESPRVESFAAGSLADADVEPVVRGFRARCEEIWGGPPPDAGACIDAELPAIWREHWERLLAQ
jgi:hypothetical protein